ncbi:MAG: aminoacyl-tRNA hydrolase [Myxococcales bacterium]|nr:MAG: aminoacyl-tRNA hydrolase [Myxococcales bacterium]
MKIVAGLGNPGERYASTRHNIGFRVADELARRHAASAFRGRFRAQAADASIAGERVLLLKPTTYMNLSGQAIQEALAFYKLAFEDLIVIHDDVDLDFGVMKVRAGGGDAGHKGIRSAIGQLGSDAFTRVRMGVGRPRFGEPVVDFVLKSFYPPEQALLDEWVAKGADAVEAALKDGATAAANVFNRRAWVKPEYPETGGAS